jgi:hypothetical protein
MLLRLSVVIATPAAFLLQSSTQTRSPSAELLARHAAVAKRISRTTYTHCWRLSPRNSVWGVREKSSMYFPKPRRGSASPEYFRGAEESLIAAWAIVSEGQNFLEQFIGKFLLLFEKWEVAGIVKPDEFLVGSLDGLAVLPNQRRRAVRIVPPLKEQDWRPEVGPEFGEINFHHFGQQHIDGELRAMDPTVVIHKGIFWS